YETVLEFTPAVEAELCLDPHPVHLLDLSGFGRARVGKGGVLAVKCGDGEGAVDAPGGSQISDIRVGAGDLSVSPEDQAVVVKPQGHSEVHLVILGEVEVDIESHVTAEQGVDLIREQGVDHLACDERVYHHRTAGERFPE